MLKELEGASYIGDGAYAKRDQNGVTLMTTDGLSITNTIVLEPETFSALMHYLKLNVAPFPT